MPVILSQLPWVKGRFDSSQFSLICPFVVWREEQPHNNVAEFVELQCIDAIAIRSIRARGLLGQLWISQDIFGRWLLAVFNAISIYIYILQIFVLPNHLLMATQILQINACLQNVFPFWNI
jgi:hypothetical protein